MSGPKPTPTSVLKLHRSWRAKTRSAEPQPQPGEPKPPPWLDREAKAEWRRIIPRLDKMGMLYLVDRSALAMLCVAWSGYVTAEKAIREHGAIVETKDSVKKSPSVAMRSDAYERWRRMMAEFGLSPSPRTKIVTLQPNGIVLLESSL